MSWRRLLVSAVAYVSLCTTTTARAQSLREAWNKPTTPFKVVGNVYYVGTEGLASYLITTPAGHVLIDGALPESAPQIAQNIEVLGFKVTDIRFLLNTHAHYDHSGGLAELKKRSGAKLLASVGDKSALESGYYLGSEQDRQLDSVPVRVDRTVKDGEKVSIGGTTLVANLTPGHTRGCTSWSTSVNDGDARYRVLFFCSATVAANRLVAPPQYPSIVHDYQMTFRRAKAMKVDVFLAPHAEFFNMPSKRAKLGQGAMNPFVDPDEFHAFIRKAEADFHEQLAKQRAAAERGSSPRPD